jgi:hypothetical protein
MSWNYDVFIAFLTTTSPSLLPTPGLRLNIGVRCLFLFIVFFTANVLVYPLMLNEDQGRIIDSLLLRS